MSEMQLATVNVAKTEILIDWLLNAAITKKLCYGHYKTEMNKLLIETYEKALLTRGVNVRVVHHPVTVVFIDDNDVTKQGVYNGEGTF